MPQNPTLPPKLPRSGVTFHFYHAYKRLMKKNEEKSFFQITFTSFTCVAHVVNSTKTTKFQMSNQPLGVNQLLRATPNR